MKKFSRRGMNIVLKRFMAGRGSEKAKVILGSYVMSMGDKAWCNNVAHDVDRLLHLKEVMKTLDHADMTQRNRELHHETFTDFTDRLRILSRKLERKKVRLEEFSMIMTRLMMSECAIGPE